MADLALAARDALERDRIDAVTLVQTVGLRRARVILQDAQQDLDKRLKARVKAGLQDTFTSAQMRATLEQLRYVLVQVKLSLERTIVDASGQASEAAATSALEYLTSADKAFGIGSRPLALREASFFEASTQGARASVLRRLASSGEPVAGADGVPHKAKSGILDRYGTVTLGHFEKVMQRGLLTGKSWGEMRDELREQSSFLRGQPAYWATRIVRTEVRSAYSRASWEGIREADQQLGDMVKIVSATFDERTGADSWNVHGQIRRPEEAFEYVADNGARELFQHPPNRPNDREIVVPHRVSWAIPGYLKQIATPAVAARYAAQKQKFHGRPDPMTTVPLAKFGK